MINMQDLLLGATIRAAHITRYSSVPVLHKESVAEHSFYVAFYTMVLADDFSLDPATRTDAIRAALLHDIEECYTGDFLRSFKKSTPVLEAAIHSAAEDCAGKILREVHPSRGYGYAREWAGAKDIKTVSGRLVMFADYLSVAMYLFKEAANGNRYVIEMLGTEFRDYTNRFKCVEFGGYEEYVRQIEGIAKGAWTGVRVTV